MDTHEMLVKNGWKIKAIPDNIGDDEIVIYNKGNEDIVLYHKIKPTLKEVVGEIANQKRHPVTGSVTTKEASELLFNATRG